MLEEHVREEFLTGYASNQGEISYCSNEVGWSSGIVING